MEGPWAAGRPLVQPHTLAEYALGGLCHNDNGRKADGAKKVG
jgi:hypothetical protein